MSELFRVEALRVAENTVTLQLVIIHPDQQRFYTTRSFALQLLWEPTHLSYEYDGKTVYHHAPSALGQAITVENIQDRDFVITHQAQIIAAVARLKTVNYPADNYPFGAVDWDNATSLPRAALEITVTEPRWIAHLHAGMVWDSAAYNMEPHRIGN